MTPAGLRTVVIDSFDRFEALRPGWQALEARDVNASIFLSWDWLAEGFEKARGRWRVIAAYKGAALVGILPLKYGVRWSDRTRQYQTVIEPGGRLLWSPVSGMLCDPGLEAAVITAMALRVRTLGWAQIVVRNEPDIARARTFCSTFEEAGFTVIASDSDTPVAGTLVSRIMLPDRYDTYLANGPGPNTRQKIRRFTRRFLDSGQLGFEFSDRHQIKTDLSSLLRLWMLQWAPKRGIDTARQVAANYLRILTIAERQNLFRLAVLRDQEAMLGALALIVDPARGAVHFIMSGRDLTTSGRPVGLLLHSQAIRWAIENRFVSYEFGQGVEPYKLALGADPDSLAGFEIHRRSGPMLDPMCHREMLANLLVDLRDKNLDRVDIGCRQILRQL
ncbi:MAG: GNAT family N-acetyltransferase [Pseudomonadota bacterium]